MVVRDLLAKVVSCEASDVHLTAELPPIVRIHGRLEQLGADKLSRDDTAKMLAEVAGEREQELLGMRGEVDFPLSLPGIGRFRVNAYRQRGSIALAMRVVASHVPNCEELGLPAVVGELMRAQAGLALVTGPTGSGKSTTLAAIIGQMNRERDAHIVTLEDPIEYLHRHERCVIHQREIGTDSESFAGALRAALRQDPDVILVGELRDLETMSIALTAAETGHLVLATLHTPTAAQAVDRLVDGFPPYQQQQVRVQLAGSLLGIIAQQLVPRCDRPGRVAAYEVLMATTAVRSLIREGKTHQLPSAIQTGARHGMVSFEHSLQRLCEQGVIAQTERDARSDGIDLGV